MKTLNVVIKLNEIICYDEGDGWGSAEPYLWAIFFKIDGSSVYQNGLMLGGEADFRFSHGSHGNLPNQDVDPGEIVPIPSNVGEWSTIVRPIEIDDFQGNTIEVPGIVGVVAVLMEEDNVTHDGAEAGHQGLNNHVRDSINTFISSINLYDFVNSDDPAADLEQKIDDLIQSIKANIADVVKNAITSNQNWLEDLWSWFNKDDKIGDRVWTFKSTEIVDNNFNIALNHRWQNEGDWEIKGEISASELCPANAINSLGERDLNQSLDLNKLRRFRNTFIKEFPLAIDWWVLVLKNSPFIIRELQKDKKLCKEVFQVVKRVENSIAKPETFSEEFFHKIDQILGRFSESRFKSLRLDSRKLKPIVQDLRGKNLHQILNHLESRKEIFQKQ